MLINRASIRLRYIIPPLIAVLCFAGVILLIASKLDEQQQTLNDVQNIDIVQRNTIEDLAHRVSLNHADLIGLIGTAGPDLNEGQFYLATKPILDDLFEIENQLTDFQQIFASAGGTEANIATLRDIFERYRGELVSAVLMTTVNRQDVQIYMVRANASFQQIVAAFNELVAETVARSRGALERLETDAERTKSLLVASLAVTVLFVLALSYFLSGVLSARIRVLIGAMKSLSEGKRDVTIVGLDRPDEIGAMARAADIFRNTLAERERAHDMLQTALESTGSAIALFDADDRLLTFNENYRGMARGAEDILRPGVTFEALLRAALAAGFVPFAGDDPEGWIRARLRQHQKPGDPKEVEFKGQWIRVEERRTPDGGYVIVMTNVTKEKQRDLQFNQAQKMEAIGRLTGGVAHDFNNLLAVIAGNLELLLERLGDRPELQKMVDRAVRASERGATLTRSLLAFSRQQPLHPVEVDINLLVGEITEMIRRTTTASVSIRVELASDIWHCLADAGQLQNALLNLVINACDAMPDGGVLTIETANISLTDDYAAAHAEVVTGEYVMLAISDTGIGMPADIAAQAFEPFFTTKDISKGTGLGLSMVYGFAKQSAGHAKIYSEVGVGTTVKIYLPRTLRDVEDRGPAIEPVHARESEKILVVEDDEDVLTMVVALLGTLGYRVEAAHDAQSGMQTLVENRDIVLLLTDVVLAGGMNGPDFARQALKVRPDLRVVLMSGYTEKAIIQNGLQKAGARLLQKPFTMAGLASVIHEVLGRESDG